MKTQATAKRQYLNDVPTEIETVYPTEQIRLLRNLLDVYELDLRLLPSLRAGLKSLEQAEQHLRAAYALGEAIEQYL